MRKADVKQFFGNYTSVVRFYRRHGYEISHASISRWGEIIPELQARRLAALTRGRERNGIKLKFDDRYYSSEPAK